MESRPTGGKVSLGEIVRVLDVGRTIPEEIRPRLAAWLRSDPRLAEEIRQLEQMAEDAGTDDAWTAYSQNQRFERWLAADEVPDEVLAPEDYGHLVGIASARLRRAEPEARRRLLRVQKNLGRSFLDGLSVVLRSGQEVRLAELAAQLAAFPPEVGAAFLRPFRRLLEPEHGVRDE